MTHRYPIFPQDDGFSAVPGRESEESRIRAVATRDHDAIERWARRHGAEPATGVATRSGPSSVDVHDGGAVVRFNFPGAAKFRPIGWDEWFECFDRDRMIFVHEEEAADRAYGIWQSRGGGDGHALDDWLEAERQLGPQASSPGQRYRIVQED